MRKEWKEEKISVTDVEAGWTRRWRLETRHHLFSVTTGRRAGRPIMAINIRNMKDETYLDVPPGGNAGGGKGQVEWLSPPSYLFAELLKNLEGLPEEVMAAIRTMPHPTSSM